MRAVKTLPTDDDTGGCPPTTSLNAHCRGGVGLGRGERETMAPDGTLTPTGGVPCLEEGITVNVLEEGTTVT